MADGFGLNAPKPFKMNEQVTWFLRLITQDVYISSNRISDRAYFFTIKHGRTPLLLDQNQPDPSSQKMLCSVAGRVLNLFSFSCSLVVVVVENFVLKCPLERTSIL